MPKHAEAARKDYTLQVRCNDAFLAAIDRWRRDQEDLPSRAEAIRRIVLTSLEFGRALKQPNTERRR